MKTWHHWSKSLSAIETDLCESINDYYSRHPEEASLSRREEVKAIKHYDTLCSIACHYYAERRTWPFLPIVAYHVLLFRVRHVAQLAIDLYQAQGAQTESAVVRPPHPDKVSEKEILTWFLVDWWYASSPCWFKKFHDAAFYRLYKDKQCIKHAIALGLKNRIVCEAIYPGSAQLGREFLNEDVLGFRSQKRS